MEDKYAAQPEQEIAPKTPDADDVDALLQDVKSLLGESDGETAEQPPPEDEPVPEGPGSEPLNAEDVHIDYGKFYGPEEQKEPEAPLTFYEQSKPAYQRARRAEYERIREQERLARAERQQAFEQERAAHMKQKKAAQKHANAHRSTAEYAEWLYTQGLSDDERSARAEQEEKACAAGITAARKAGKAEAAERTAHCAGAGSAADDRRGGVSFSDRPRTAERGRAFRPQKKAARPSSSQARTRAATVPTPCCC
ncbi:MAG: hypothetical protein ACLR5X_00985 [Oscillospiraceae bacterium]